MDNCTIILELIRASPWIISALAWPAVVFGTVLLFRKPIEKLLPFVRAKYGELEIRFRLDKAAKTAEKLVETPADTIAPPTPEEQERFSELVKESPRTAILAMRANLEEAIVSYAEARALVVPGRRRNIANLIRVLRKRGFIDKTISTLLDDLRSIGNSVALDISEPTESEAFRYKELADDVIKQLNFLTSEAQKPTAIPSAG
ncbi:MAG: DUF4145 domain-containing protein [Burkholderiales bacterium]